MAEQPKVAQFVGIIVSAVSTYYCGACSIGFNAAYDARLTYAATGDYNAAAKAGATTATISTAFYVVGAATSGKGITTGTKVFAHAMVGGVASVLQGGKFGHGFASAGLSKFVMLKADFDVEGNRDPSAIMGRTAVAALVGGTTSKITGGKFANGAKTAAIAHLLNSEVSTEARLAAQKGQNIIKNDYLSWEEADEILRNNTDPNLIVAVKADMLVVKQTSNFYVDPKTGDVRAGGMMMGIPEYLVHGQVTIRDRGDGTFGIYQQQYNFEQRPVNSVYDVVRNVETFIGGVVSSNGTPFWIQYDGNANVIKK